VSGTDDAVVIVDAAVARIRQLTWRHGIEVEVSWLVPADLIDDEVAVAKATIRPLDIGRDKQRYGATIRGGVGVATG
jgi:hypothetical protein